MTNGGIGAPLPPIADNKSKEEANIYKKQAAESERKLVSVYYHYTSYLIHDTITCIGLEALFGKWDVYTVEPVLSSQPRR